MGEVVRNVGVTLPEEFGDYSVVAHLATGGMAEVYLARQSGIEGFERLVVIKRVRTDLMSNREFTRSLLAEARMVATLQHPNITQVHGVGRVNDTFFMVMEYLPGVDLGQVLGRVGELGGAIDIEDAVYIVIQVGLALHYAHEKRGADGQPLGIIHRDVTPSNILLSYDGAVKICDFGIAKATRYFGDSEAGVIKGKYGYLSPEQCKTMSLDRRSDIFALGIVLYELTTMTRPFAATSGPALLRMIAADRPRSPSSRVKGYPAELERIVMRALANDRADRYPTAQAMLLDLEAFAREYKLGLSSVNIARLMSLLFGDQPSVPAAVADQPRHFADASVTRKIPVDVLAAAARSTDPAFELLGATWPGLADGARGDARGDAVASSLPPVPPPLHGPLVMVDRASARLGRALLTAPGRPRGKLWLGAAAFVGLVAGGASLYDRELQRSSTSALASTLELDAERLAAAVEAGVQLATARATGLAADPVLRAAIETDAATLHDLAREAPAFAIGAGETLEVVQRRAGATISLLHLPANAPAIVEPTGGAARVVTVDGVLTVIASVPVAPSSTAGASAGISGVVTLAARLDLGSATAQLARHVRAAALRGPGFELDLVASPGAAGGVVSVVPLPSARAPGALSLVSRLATVVQPSDWVRPVQLAGASLGVLLLACFAWPRGRQHDQEILHDEGHSTARAMSWRATRSSRRRRRATSTAAVSVPAYKRRTA